VIFIASNVSWIDTHIKKKRAWNKGDFQRPLDHVSKKSNNLPRKIVANEYKIIKYY